MDRRQDIMSNTMNSDQVLDMLKKTRAD